MGTKALDQPLIAVPVELMQLRVNALSPPLPS